MTVSLGADVLFKYERFSLYNSPYVAHDEGCAIDLYPGGQVALSPVAGEVLAIRAVDAPPKPDAAEQDYLLLIDTGSHVARILHVTPEVTPGDTVAVGDSLGTLIRSGYFAPWVSNHVHLGFRPPEANHERASGSVPIDVDVPLRGISWDGSGTVVEMGKTWALLDSPSHPDPGAAFVGLESDGGVLDGGFPHYDTGGLFGDGKRAVIAGQEVGTVSGRTVTWDDCAVLANGEVLTGLSLYCARDRFGLKLVEPEPSLSLGDRVEISIGR